MRYASDEPGTECNNKGGADEKAIRQMAANGQNRKWSDGAGGFTEALYLRDLLNIRRSHNRSRGKSRGKDTLLHFIHFPGRERQ